MSNALIAIFILSLNFSEFKAGMLQLYKMEANEKTYPFGEILHKNLCIQWTVMSVLAVI